MGQECLRRGKDELTSGIPSDAAPSELLGCGVHSGILDADSGGETRLGLKTSCGLTSDSTGMYFWKEFGKHSPV